MATEKYGIYGELIESIAATPVSTDTRLIFIGTCAGGELNRAYDIASFADYVTILGGSLGDGHNLTEAAIAAFQIVNLSGVVMIPVSHDVDPSASVYIGDGISTGAAAIERYLAANPAATVLICAPGLTNATALAAIKSACHKADGHWDSFLLFDTEIPSAAVNENGVFVDSSAVGKPITDEYSSCCAGKIKTDGGYILSLSALRACLMAHADASYGVPARSGGNLAMQGVTAWGMIGTAPETVTFESCQVRSIGSIIYVVDSNLNKVTFGLDDETATAQIIGSTSATVSKFTDGGQSYWRVTGTPESSPFTFAVTYSAPAFVPVDIPEARATELSANGICAVVNYSGTFYTWGDHTSAFNDGAVVDERARFDNTIRMQIMITNRAQLKYRKSIDAPMTLQMRDDVINEELDYLASLVAIGALIGEPTCEFSPLDNPTDGIAQGQFVWRIADTPTIPFKYGNFKIAYTQAGLSVYLQE